jgi:mannosyl-3-phosphoglycerate phosphatase
VERRLINEKPYTVVFTDLDGTLLGADYRPGPARAAVAALDARGVPLVFCSSKTRAEQEVIRADLGVTGPFIVENGAALLIPEGYFTFQYDAVESSDYCLIEFAEPYAEIRQALARVRDGQGLALRGYGDMTVSGVSALTGLDDAASRRAMRREYAETVVFDGDAEEKQRAITALAAAGLEVLPGSRFHSLHRGADKGRAARALIDLYRRQYGTVRSAGIGDGPNDVSLLRTVDLPRLVRRSSGEWLELELPGLRRFDGIGPDGFVQAVNDLLSVDIT